jgi:hypothetical protein
MLLSFGPLDPLDFPGWSMTLSSGSLATGRPLLGRSPACPGRAPTEDGAVDILTVSDWGEEDAIPFRLFFPDDIGFPPQGNEHALRVRVAYGQAWILDLMFSAACNDD